jgi:hypothetical protein
VSPVIGEVIVDACTLWNFAVVERLDLLEVRYGHRGVRWTARRRGLTILDTPRVLADCYASGEIGCPAAYELLGEMWAKGRGVRMPLSHRDVCP